MPSNDEHDDRLAEINGSLLELTLETYPTHQCNCKGMCRRGCPCSKHDQRCGKECKCKEGKCKNRKEEVYTFTFCVKIAHKKLLAQCCKMQETTLPPFKRLKTSGFKKLKNLTLHSNSKYLTLFWLQLQIILHYVLGAYK